MNSLKLPMSKGQSLTGSGTDASDLHFTPQELNDLAYSIGPDFGLSDISDIQLVEENVNTVPLLDSDDPSQMQMHTQTMNSMTDSGTDLDMDSIVIETINNDVDMSDAVVFGNVANEVSISSSGIGHFERQSQFTHTSGASMRTLQQSQSIPKRTVKPSPAKIRAPQSHVISAPNQFIPISGINFSQLSSSTPLFSTISPQVKPNVPLKGKVIKKSPSVGTVVPIDSSSTLKVIYASHGQQIVLSPTKQQTTLGTNSPTVVNLANTAALSKFINIPGGTSTGKVISISNASSTTMTSGKVLLKPIEAKKVTTLQSNQQPQQVFILSPMKTGASGSGITINQGNRLMPAKSPQRPLAPAPPTPKIAISKSGSAVSQDVKPVQLIRVVPVSTAQSTGTITSGKFVPIRPIAPNTRPQASFTTTGTMQKVLVPASAIKAMGGTPISVTTSGSNLPQGTIFSTTGPGGTGQVFMLPNTPLLKLASSSGTSQSGSSQKTVSFANPQFAAARTNYVPIAPSPMTASSSSASLAAAQLSSLKLTNGAVKVEEPQQRKPCNCTKSQCLKLYCDCFANGEFCSACNCVSCHNNLDHEEDRQKAIRQCLERNPQAFHPKIGKGRAGDLERRHTKGCNCRRSGCLKNYCECYEAKILCSGLCKCVGCKNFEESFERKTLMHLADAAELRTAAQQTVATKTRLWSSDFRPKLPIKIDGDRLPCTFITPEVVEATCQCLLAQAEHGEKNRFDCKGIEMLVLEEFGRCLTQIIECSNKTRFSRVKQELL